MSIHLISYDLVAPGRDYSSLIKKIKTADGWCHVLESTWLVKTDKTASQIYSLLTPLMDSNDKLFVARIDQTNKDWYVTNTVGQTVIDWIRWNL